jgi:hypothetical protein
MIGDATPQGNGDEVVPAARLRASHEDRDRVVEMLRVAAGDGRLTAEELDERLEFALTARTYGELTALTADLPEAGGLPAGPATSAMPVTPKEVALIDCHSGNAKRNGRWIVPKRMEIRVTSGNVRLDFTEAVISQPLLEIDAQVRSGNLLVITKPGIVVDTDEVAVRSGNVRVKAPWSADVPVRLRIVVSGKVGSGNICARPPRRTFWQWLRREPKPYAITAR